MMKSGAVCSAGILVLILRLSSVAMDGVSVTAVQGSGYELISYQIQNNAVKSQRVLCSQSQPLWSPSVNPSGTHAIFYRGVTSGGKIRPTMAIVNLETGVWKDVCQIEDSLFGYVPVIWWLHDGSAVVWINWCTLYKFRMTKSGTTTTVTKALFGKFDQFPQHQYVDISMDGKIISYRTYDPACATTKMSAQFIGPIPASPTTLMGAGTPGFKSPCGCGNAVSPDGSLNGCFQGSGHEATTYQNTATGATVYQFSNITNLRTWCNCGLPESSYGGTDFGHGWSVNSTKWTVVSYGCDNRFAKTAAGQFLINISEQKAIDVTRFCVDGSGKKAHRGDLWVSNQSDVDAAYWSYAQNRDQYRATWDDIMAGLPGTAQPPVTDVLVRLAGAVGTRISLVRDSRHGLVVRGTGIGTLRAELFDLEGRRITSALGTGQATLVRTTGLSNGYYLMRVYTDGTPATFRIVL